MTYRSYVSDIFGPCTDEKKKKLAQCCNGMFKDENDNSIRVYPIETMDGVIDYLHSDKYTKLVLITKRNYSRSKDWRTIRKNLKDDKQEVIIVEIGL